jgi:hypothetical protein
MLDYESRMSINGVVNKRLIPELGTSTWADSTNHAKKSHDEHRMGSAMVDRGSDHFAAQT